MMPYLDGISLLKILRKQNINTPVIILSALNSTENKIEVLNQVVMTILLSLFR